MQGSCDYLGPPHQGLMEPWGLDSHSKAVPRSPPGNRLVGRALRLGGRGEGEVPEMAAVR